MKPLCIDLFCGLGGWTEGFLAEGWDCVGFDTERHVYGQHRYPAQLVLQDVRTLHGSQFRDARMIVASSPCQEFSYRAMPWKLAKALGPPETGVKQGGDWFNAASLDGDGQQSISRRSGSKSGARKAVSARIAKIPFPLASYIAKTFTPHPALPAPFR